MTIRWKIIVEVVVITAAVSFSSGTTMAQTTQYAAGTFVWGTDSAWAQASGGIYNQAWTNGNDAVFEGTAGTVSIAAAGVTAHNLTFTNVTGYTITANTLTLSNATPTITVGTNLSATISSVIAGTNGLIKSGTGTLALSGVNTYTGKIVVNGGTLSVSASTALGASPGSLVTNQITLDGGTLGGTVDSSSGNNRGILLGSNGGTLTLGQWMGPFSGPGNLYINNGGEMRLNGGSPFGAQGAYDNTFTGDTILLTAGLRICRPLSLQNSTLDITYAVPFDSYGNSYLVIGGLKGTQNWSPTDNGFGGTTPISGGVFVGNNNKDTTYSGVLGGSATPIIKIGTGTLTLTGNNSFAGQLTIKSGTLAVPSMNDLSANGPLGSNAFAVIMATNGVTATLRMTGTNSAAVSSKPFSLFPGGTGAFQIDVAATTQTVSGIIDGAGNLMKTGPGTLILAATNTYAGDTIISNGMLGISVACLSATSSVHIAKDAKFALNYSGTATICSLYLDGQPMTPDNYGFTASYGQYFSGPGKLLVTNGPAAKGTVLTIR